MRVLLFFLFLSLNSFAQDENCIPVEENNLQNHIHKLLDWFGAADKQVEKAPCKVKSVPSESEMNRVVNSKAKGPLKNETVHGVRFKNESQALIEAFKHFTTAKDAFGISNVPANQKNIQTEYRIPPECDKVMCAMEKIWGKDYATKLLYVKLKHNFNSSELAFDNSDRFKPEEFNDVILGLEDIPPHLNPVGQRNQRLTHFKRGYTLKQYSSSTLANAVVMFFDSWGKKSPITRQYTMFHEMAHNISGKLRDMDESPEWLNLSGWVKKGDEWNAGANACLPSKYGATNPWEDFAESLSAYRYNGAQFKSKCPVKFEFLKSKVFRGVDYTDVKNCSQVPAAKIQQAQKAIIDEVLNSVGKLNFDDQEILEACDNGFSNYPIQESELAQCSLKLHSSKSLSGQNSKIGDILKNAGIPDTAANRDLIMSGINEEFSEEMLKDIGTKSSAVETQINSIVDKSFIEANPKGFSQEEINADDYRFRLSLKECGSGFFAGQPETVKECQLKKLIAQDRTYQTWDRGLFPMYKVPRLFKNHIPALTEKREAALFEHLSKHPLSDEVLQKELKQFQDDMKYHMMSSESKIRSLPNWKNMSSEEFCKETYGGGSSWTDQYGVSAGKPIPLLFENCVSEQGKKSKRFEFKQTQWTNMLSK